VSRDDEEFVIYEFQDFEAKPTLWQRFTESSNYFFEWPYVCCLIGKSQILIMNAFVPSKATIIDLKSLPEDATFSHLYLTESLQLYFVVATNDNYLVYEKELDAIMTTLVLPK